MEEHNLFAVLDRLAATLPEAPLMATSETIVPDNREKPLKPLKRLGKALRGLRFWKN